MTALMDGLPFLLLGLMVALTSFTLGRFSAPRCVCDGVARPVARPVRALPALPPAVPDLDATLVIRRRTGGAHRAS
ncbi:hypothetical protein [Parafrankia sp. EUN1f]|uniref:hypothetical protein n=1 Tax=Parafrankia sp. EUN1f TaxID=102897 RepID=UPI0001C47569|nr:hypothetical protein [Parafrankia sp. EUN1f]EFC79307.1 hypothetical protein FrEUN1fDRAFT_7582 [Parafrankia sp. EUN1f]